MLPSPSASSPPSPGMGFSKSPGKKLIIKPFKESPKLPATFEQDTWAKLHAAVVGVQRRQGVGISEEELYTAVQDLCIHKLAAEVYERLRQTCAQHITATLSGLVGQEPDLQRFLYLVAGAWDAHCEQMLTIKLLFGYLDRTYVISNGQLLSIWDMGLDLFGRALATYGEVQLKTVEGLLLLISKERDSEIVDRPLIQKLVRMFLALQTYKTVFEAPFLVRSHAYYAKEGPSLLENLQVSFYLLHVERRLAEESDRALSYLDASTRRPLIAVVEQHLLHDHVAAILEKGFASLMEQAAAEDLARMYRLLSLVAAHDQLRANFQTFIKRVGLGIVMDEERDAHMVQELLAFKAKLDGIWEKAFARNEVFGHTLRDSFESFVNQRPNKPAELIAKFLDVKLRAGTKGETEEEIEDLMDRVLDIFRFVSSKDVFEAFYKKDLAKRLLLGKSASADAEKGVIARLKAECGTQLSGKLEGMFKDIDLSRDVMASFRQSKDSRDRRMGDVEFNVFVLTSGYWPTYPLSEVMMPPELADHQAVFQTFYLAKHQGRRLVWQPSLAHCLLRANFPSGHKELHVSLYQALVLLLFNSCVELGYREIKDRTGIEDAELRRTLQSLSLAAVRPLKKRPKGKDIADTDMFAYASDFQHSLTRIRVNQIQIRETPEEHKECTERIVGDRQHQIDAAIVRIMKARKTLPHSGLLQELFLILKFPVQAADLKKRMESLIEREYMSRDEENPTVYHYMA